MEGPGPLFLLPAAMPGQDLERDLVIQALLVALQLSAHRTPQLELRGSRM